MNEYWNRPEENAQRSRNGWHHTNDLGRREADGTITFVGPKGRMIKSAAENIYPAEVEGCIAAHPAVADVAIIGMPDPKWVQSVKAIVVRRRRHVGRRATRSSSTAGSASRRTRSPARSSSSTRSPATASSWTTTRSTSSSAAATTPAAGPAAHDLLPGRLVPPALRMTVVDDAGAVEAGLEDDFHYFRVRVGTTGDRHARPGRGAPLAVDDVPRCGRPAARARGDAAVAAVPRGRRRSRTRSRSARTCSTSPASRSRTRRVAVRRDGASVRHRDPGRGPPRRAAAVTCARDGELLHTWRWTGGGSSRPSRSASVPWRGGFLRWADETFDADGAEAAIVLRRACDIGLGRGMDLDAVDRADEMPRQMAGVCFTMQPAQIAVSLRNKGTIRDFDADPDALLATTDAMRVLAACSFGGAGHLHPLLPSCAAAREQGHETLVVGPARPGTDGRGDRTPVRSRRRAARVRGRTDPGAAPVAPPAEAAVLGNRELFGRLGCTGDAPRGDGRAATAGGPTSSCATRASTPRPSPPPQPASHRAGRDRARRGRVGVDRIAAPALEAHGDAVVGRSVARRT